MANGPIIRLWFFMADTSLADAIIPHPGTICPENARDAYSTRSSQIGEDQAAWPSSCSTRTKW
jgi:hypothetical protein